MAGRDIPHFWPKCFELYIPKAGEEYYIDGWGFVSEGEESEWLEQRVPKRFYTEAVQKEITELPLQNNLDINLQFAKSMGV